MKWVHWLLVLVVLCGMIASVRAKKLTLSAALTGGLLTLCIYIGAGGAGVVLLAVFFLLGSVFASWAAKKRKWLMMEEGDGGRRTWTQVVANAGVAALLSLVSFFFPQREVMWQLMIAASFSSATADTLSSELGNVYGKRFYNILTFRKDTRGLDGVVSLEGTLIGMAGSVMIATVFCIGYTQNFYLFGVVVISGTIGNLSDSVLGARYERTGLLKNDAVNFLNTLIAALAAALLF